MEYIPLTAEERHQFTETGYLIVRNVLSAEKIADLIQAADQIFETNPIHKRQRKAKGVWDSYRNCITLDERFIPLITQPRILSYIVQLLGTNLHLITSHLIYRYPDAPGTSSSYRPFGWHRDIAHMSEDLGYAHTPRAMIKCAYYLTDLPGPDYGTTLVLPGSNHLKTSPVFQDGQPDPFGTVEPCISAGDCLLFENRTWHAVGANLHEQIRKTLIFGYGYRWLKPADYLKQSSEIVGKLNLMGRFLVGEQISGAGRFRIGGGSNPLQEWADENNLVYTPPTD